MAEPDVVALSTALANVGLHTSQSRLGQLVEPSLEGCSADKALSLLLNVDLRKFAEGAIPEGLGKVERTLFPGPAIVQICRLVNCCEPSYNQHSQGRHKLMLLTLTDGKRDCLAIEFGPVSGLTFDTPPGTKLQITNAHVLNGVVLLDRTCCVVKGGSVATLKEEWEQQKRYGKAARQMMSQGGGKRQVAEDDDAPPPFEKMPPKSSRPHIVVLC